MRVIRDAKNKKKCKRKTGNAKDGDAKTGDAKTRSNENEECAKTRRSKNEESENEESEKRGERKQSCERAIAMRMCVYACVLTQQCGKPGGGASQITSVVLDFISSFDSSEIVVAEGGPALEH